MEVDRISLVSRATVIEKVGTSIATGDFNSLQWSIATLNSEIPTMRKQISTIQQTLNNNNINIHAVQTDVTNLKSAICTSNSNLTNMKTDVNTVIDINQKSIHDLTSRITADETNSKIFVKSKD